MTNGTDTALLISALKFAAVLIAAERATVAAGNGQRKRGWG